MKRNNDNLTYEMQAQLELKAVPQAVEEKLRQVYAELPDQVPARRRSLPHWAQRTLVTASSLAAAFAVLLGVNGANPAFAESLPFVGGIFQNINRQEYVPVQNMTDTQQRIGDLAVTVEDQTNTITVPANGLMEKAVTANLKEIYYDGSFVFAGIEFEMDADGDRINEVYGPGYDVLINGESQIPHGEDGYVAYPNTNDNGFIDMRGSYYWTQVEKGRYIMQRAFRVPDALQGAESLDVTLCFDSIEDDDKMGKVNSTPFKLDFTAKKSDVAVRSIDCQGLEMGGVKLLSAYTTPAGTYIEVEYPNRYVNPAEGAKFDDGLYIGGYNGTDIDLEGDVVRSAAVCAGLKEDESRKVVWSLFDKNGSGQYEAVFVLDFQNGTAQLGSADDVKPAPTYDYACGVEAVKALQKGEYAVEKLHLDQDKPMLYIMTGDGEKDLRVEMWQDGKRVSTVNTESYSWSPDLVYWEYYNLDNGSATSTDDTWYEGTEHNTHMLLVNDLYVTLDPTAPVTVKAFDKNSGDQLMEEEIRLTLSETHPEPEYVPDVNDDDDLTNDIDADGPITEVLPDAVSSEVTE